MKILLFFETSYNVNIFLKLCLDHMKYLIAVYMRMFIFCGRIRCNDIHFDL